MREIVKTEGGEVRGVMQSGILQFRGIPYGKPPVGSRRFCLPEPFEAWEGVRDAGRRGPIPPQRASDLDLPMGPVLLPRSEDCLTLTVSTPSPKEELPVAVWFHGGANCYGGGDLEWYDGAKLAEKGHMVVVNVNFRLGPFGFFQYPGISEHNLSVEDQMLALRWIRRNIRAFGGDPGKVTLFGQSAGANAIVHILSRPDSRDLFGQVILQSPSLGRGNHLQEDAFAVGRSLVKNLGISGDEKEAVKEKLQFCSVDEILDAAEGIDTELLAKHQGMVFKPVMDSWHTPEETIQAAAEAAAERKVRIVIGTTKEEMNAFLTGRDEETVQKAAQIQQMRYELPARAFACLAAQKGCSVWKYRFDWKAGASRFGACHCLELPFVFGNLEAWDAPMLDGASREEMERLVSVMQEAWCGFFRYEVPKEAKWPEYNGESCRIKCFDNEKNPVMKEADDIKASGGKE